MNGLDNAPDIISTELFSSYAITCVQTDGTGVGAKVTFQPWEDQYLFEILPRETARILAKRYCINTLSKLRSYSKRSINHMPSSILSIIRPLVEE